MTSTRGPKVTPLNATADRRTFARWYLDQGWSVIPIRPMEKKPLVDWKRFQDERASTQEIDAWLARWPEMNLGIVTGSISGIAVLDVDGPRGLQSLQERGLEIPDTLRQRTPHGWHYVFRLDGQHIKTAAGVFPGVDVRGQGGYAVVAPSRLPDGEYTWHSE